MRLRCLTIVLMYVGLLTACAQPEATPTPTAVLTPAPAPTLVRPLTPSATRTPPLAPTPTATPTPTPTPSPTPEPTVAAPTGFVPAPIRDLRAQVSQALVDTCPSPECVNLNWTAPSGDDQAATYEIRYSTAAITEGNWDAATLAGYKSPGPPGSREVASVTRLTSGVTYYFAVRTSDVAGNVSPVSNATTYTAGLLGASTSMPTLPPVTASPTPSATDSPTPPASGSQILNALTLLSAPPPRSVFYGLSDLPPLALIGEFNGIDMVYGGNPPYLEIAAGPETLVLSSSDSVVILDKEGTLLAASSIHEFFDSVRTKVASSYQYEESPSDPTITFDHWSQRFFLVAAGRGFSDDCPPDICLSNVLLAVSKSASPATTSDADWYFYALDGVLESLGVRGVDQTVIRSAEEFILVAIGIEPFPGEPGGHLFRILPKTKLVDGVPLGASDWVDLRLTLDDIRELHGEDDVLGFRPAEHLGTPRSGTFFMLSARANCTITVLGIDNALTSPKLSRQIVLPTGVARRCGVPEDPPQPNGPPLQGVGGNAVYRNGSLWFVQSIEFGDQDQFAAVRWVEIDVSNWPSPPRIVQESVFGAEGAWLISPAMAVDESGNVAIVHGRTSGEEFPSVYYTGRLASDPLNTLRTSSLLKAGVASLDLGLVGAIRPGESATGESGAQKYGPYFGAAIDPVDGTAWLLGQYVKATGCWGSWVGHVDFESSTLGIESAPTLPSPGEPVTTCPREGRGTTPEGYFEVVFETALAPGTVAVGPKDSIPYRFRVVGFGLRSLSLSHLKRAISVPPDSQWYYDGSTNLYVFLDPSVPAGEYAVDINLPSGRRSKATFIHTG